MEKSYAVIAIAGARTMLNQIEALYLEQIETWPRLARGVEGLRRAQTRALRVDWFDVYLRHIPHRVASTTAAVDPKSISERPCFLCQDHLDPEERGVPFGADYTIYCNPFPIVDRHLTIVHRMHKPQRVAGEFGTMLDLAEALPGYFVIYNGPECGASAPDHMHFQAGSRALFPIERDSAAARGLTIANYARNVFVFRDSARSRLMDRTHRALSLLQELSPERPEPMVNIAGFYDAGEWRVFVFPRSKHRPEAYYTGEMTVSPAAIDLCGILVAPFEKDFARITAHDVNAVFKEVTLPDQVFQDAASKL